MNNSLEFLESLETKQDDPAARYSISVNIEIKFTRSKAKDALGVQITNNPNASEIRLTEEQVWEKYPWDYDRLTGECRKRHRGSSWPRNSTTFASSSPPMPGLVMCAISSLAIQKVRSSRSLTKHHRGVRQAIFAVECVICVPVWRAGRGHNLRSLPLWNFPATVQPARCRSGSC